MSTEQDNQDGKPTGAIAPGGASGSGPGIASGGKDAKARSTHAPAWTGLRPRLSLRARSVSPLPGETQQYRGTRRHVIVSGVLLTIILSVIMTVSVIPGQVDIQPGVPASQDIFSPSYLRYESKLLTERARQEAMRDPANEVWVQDTAVVQRQRSILVKNLSAIDMMRSNPGIDPSVSGVPPSMRLDGVKMPQAQLTMLLGLSETDYDYWRNSGVLPAFDGIMRERRLTGPADVNAARASLPDRLIPSLPADQKTAAVTLIAPLLVPNMNLDNDQTEQRRQAAANAVRPIVVTVQKGEVILRVGAPATAEDIEKMQEAGLFSRTLSPQTVVGTVVMVSLLMLLLHLYIYRYTPQVWHRQKQLLLVGLLIVATIAVARTFLPGHATLPYLLPLASVSMLIAVLLSANLAVLVTFILSVLLGLVAGSAFSMDLPIYYFVGSLTGIFTLTRVEKVSTFALAGLYIAVASFLAGMTARLLTGSVLDWSTPETLGLAAAFNGGVSASITYVAFSLLGTLFGITTPLQLMELAHPDQPLLRRLMREAPGTYHHSLVVSNLAERAAEMVGADALLTRVCAYYHDIGKVERPYYFIDNQSGRANVHDTLGPRDSARIIAGHVLDGVRMGQRNRLPGRVLDAIPQHHGTMLIKYFYYKALQEDPNTNPDDFRYPGPKPQTKENAILMLADGVEAAVRSMAQSGALDKQAPGSNDASESPGLYNDTASLPNDVVADVVHKIISERIEDGQLDDCDLTVRDIARIQEAFVSMLKGIYHPRIAYPEPPKASPAMAAVVEEVAAPSPATEEAAAPAMPPNGHGNAASGNGANGLVASIQAESKHEERSSTGV